MTNQTDMREAAQTYLSGHYPRASEVAETHTYADGSKLYAATLGPVFPGGHSRYVRVRVHTDGTIHGLPKKKDETRS